ncbi:MAG: hypothetical protein WC916_02825 [Candidatus Woesearchaeota archaeon]
MDELVNAMRTLLQKSSRSMQGDTVVMGKSYTSIPITKNNFHPIIAFSNKETDNHSFLFVDGGNTTLFLSAGLAIGFIRTAGIVYQDNKRIHRDTLEFFIIVHEQESIMNVHTFPKTSFDGLVFNPDDESLRNGLERSECSRIITVIRRFAELEYASLLGKKYAPTGIILDGTLESKYPHESDYIAALLAQKNVCALSKTCSLTTKNGSAITQGLFSLEPSAPFWYHPIAVNNNSHHPAEIYFIKLHDKTDYVFRFEVGRGFSGDVSGIIALLARNSIDPVFLGYPYGFIDVDAAARISEDEKRLLQTKLSVKLGKGWDAFSTQLTSMNAHEILDKIKF